VASLTWKEGVVPTIKPAQYREVKEDDKKKEDPPMLAKTVRAMLTPESYRTLAIMTRRLKTKHVAGGRDLWEDDDLAG
jgi:hypothetical protein